MSLGFHFDSAMNSLVNILIRPQALSNRMKKISALYRNSEASFSLSHASLDKNQRLSVRFLGKLMNRSKTKGKFYFLQTENTPTPIDKDKPKPMNYRRMTVLNKLFMKNITEVLATGNVALTVESLNIEICKVAISPDFQYVNVFYISTKQPRPPNWEQLLVDTAFSLRHELSQLKLMGEVPLINFVEDKMYMRIVEVEGLLAKADKGTDEDDESHDENYLLHVEEAIEKMNSVQNAYGLNHSRLYDKVITAKKASNPLNRNKDTINIQEGVAFSTCEPQRTLELKKSEAPPRYIVRSYLKETKVKPA